LEGSVVGFAAGGNVLTVMMVGDFGTSGRSYLTSVYGPYSAQFQLLPVAVVSGGSVTF
jgi:hypothetical protein